MATSCAESRPNASSPVWVELLNRLMRTVPYGRPLLEFGPFLTDLLLRPSGLLHGFVHDKSDITSKPAVVRRSALSPSGAKRHRDLLPFPGVDFAEYVATQSGSDRSSTAIAAGVSWLKLLVAGLNSKYSLGSEEACQTVTSSAVTLAQHTALGHLAQSACSFVDHHPCPVDLVDWEQELSSKCVSYEGEETYTAEIMTWERIKPGLPPPEACGCVAAEDVCLGHVRECVLSPELVRLPPNQRGERPRTPTIWCDELEWEVIASELVARGILEPVAWEDIEEVDGEKVLNGMFGVRKPSEPDGGTLRLVMNMIPSNWMQQTIVGDMDVLPHASQWHGLVLEEGEFLLWSEEDQKCCFYVYRLPKSWRGWMAFCRPIRGELVGGTVGQVVYLASAVVPMGWASATGIIQHIHRQMLLQPPPFGGGLNGSLEIRRDRPLPTRREPGFHNTTPDQVSHVQTAEGLPAVDGAAASTPHMTWQARQVYIDNLDVLEIWRELDLCAHMEGTLSPMAARAREAYERHGVPRSVDKSVQRRSWTKSLGSAVRGRQGVLAPPAEFLARLMSLTLFTISFSRVTKRWLQVVTGRWIRAMMFRRHCMCCFDTTWKVLAKWRGAQALPTPVRLELLHALALLPCMFADLRTPVSGLVTVSDASLRSGAACRSTGVTQQGLSSLAQARRGRHPKSGDEVVLFALFEGIGGARRALDMLNLQVALHLSSEVDEDACRVVKYTWPDAVEVGDVCAIAAEAVREWRQRAAMARWLLLVAGSPCQDLSSLNADRAGLSGSRSSLFFEIVRVRALLRQEWPEVEVVTLVENVASMADEARDAMSAALALTPVFIDPADVTDCHRPRYYWLDQRHCVAWQGLVSEHGSVPHVHLPGGRGSAERWLSPKASWAGEGLDRRLPTLVRCIPRNRPPKSPAGIARCDDDTLARWRAARFCYAPYQFRAEHCVVQDGALRTPNSEEREVLMDFVPRHTITAKPTRWRKQHASDLEACRCALVGNSFQCSTVAWFLAHWAVHTQYLPRVPTVVEMREAACHTSVESGDAAVELNKLLVQHADVRGSDVRLDTNELMRPDLWPRRPINVDQWSWRTIMRWDWVHAAHITSLEMRATLSSHKWRFRSAKHVHTRFPHLMDSQAGLGVMTRCRSSSHVLNVIVCRADALCIAASAYPVYGYTDTDRNPADAPTRIQGDA